MSLSTNSVIHAISGLGLIDWFSPVTLVDPGFLPLCMPGIFFFLIAAVSNISAPGFCRGHFFHGLELGWGRFQDDSSSLHLLYILFLLLLHQSHHRLSGMRSWRLGTPVLLDIVNLPYFVLKISCILQSSSFFFFFPAQGMDWKHFNVWGSIFKLC